MENEKGSKPLELIIKNILLSLTKALVTIFLGLFIWNNLVSGSLSYILGSEFPKLDIASWIVYYSISSIAFIILDKRDKKVKKKGDEIKNLYSTSVALVLSIVPSFYVWNKILVPVMISSFSITFPVVSFLEFLALQVALIFMYLLTLIPLTLVILMGILIHKKITKN